MIDYHDVECPYCNAGNDIDTENCHDYDENEKYSQECDTCHKYFSFSVSMSFDYEVNQADCLNDGEHRWEEMKTYAAKYTKLKCQDCGEVKPLSKERLSEIIKEDGNNNR